MGKKEALKGKGGKNAAKQKKNKPKPPPLLGIPCPDQMWGPEGDMPPWMRGPFPDEMWGPEGDMPPWEMDEMWGPEGDMPPWEMGRYSDEMWGPDGHMPPDMEGPFPGPRFRGPMPPGMRGPFPGPKFRGPMPPGMRGPFPGPRFRDPRPPDVRGPFPGPRFRDPRPPDVRGPFPGPRFSDPRPPDVRGPLPGPRFREPLPPEMRGPFPGPRRGDPMPSEMRGLFPGPRSEGPIPPEMRGPFPGPRSEGPIPPEMDRLPEPRRGSPMPPEVRRPFLDPQRRGPVPPVMQGMSQNEMCEPRRNVSPWAGEPNVPPCEPWLEAGSDARRPGPSPALWQEELEKYGPAQGGNYSFPSGSHSSDHLASINVANKHYLQESASKILESFGLSNEDLQELSRYPEDQLKPENMPEILREIRMKKAAHHLPELPFQETVGGDGLYSPSGAQVAMAPASEAWRMNCPTPSMIRDYSGSSPRLFPHTCALCKVECKHLRGWILHLNAPGHLESCHHLRQQYPEWEPEDASFNNRSENQAPSQWLDSSSPAHSISGQDMQPSRSRSRSPLHRREMSTEAHAKPKNDPQSTDLNSLVEKSVSQAMSMLQAGGTGAAGLPALPSLQLDSAALSLGLVSMMQLVATQVVQTVLSSKENANEQAKPNTATLAPQPSTSASNRAVKQEAAAEAIPPSPSDVVGPVSKRHVLIVGHSYIVWADRQARKSSFGRHLGLEAIANVEWRGRRNLRWDGLVSQLLMVRKGDPPDLLVIHLGGSDLGLVKGKTLVLRAAADLRKIKKAWPHTDIAWSAIIPRHTWPGGAEVKLIDTARKRFNRAMLHYLRHGLGFFIPHPAITHLREDFYREDGIHLSDAGNHQFLRDLQNGIRAILTGSVGDWGEVGACP